MKNFHNRMVGLKLETLKIKAFLLVAKYKNFSLAAKELSYTPSALSHIADSLENELGVKLFNRTRKGVEITEEGKKLYDYFLKIAKAEEELYKASANIRVKRETELKIGAFSSLALHILPEILYGFKQKYPQINVEILVDDNMHHWLKDGLADIILADEPLGFENFCPLFEEEYVAVVKEDNFKDIYEIDSHKLYSNSYIRPNEEFLDNYFDYEKFHEVIPVNSVENDTALYMVKEGLGVTVVPKTSADNCPNGLKTLKIKPTVKRTVGVAYSKDSCSLICEKFVQYIKKEFVR